jgi:hypothetical protein
MAELYSQGETDYTIPGQHWIKLEVLVELYDDCQIISDGPVPGQSTSCTILFLPSKTAEDEAQIVAIVKGYAQHVGIAERSKFSLG